MKLVLGAGVSGLLWAYYHTDYVVYTDQVGRAVTGADPLIWLNRTDLTERLLRDLGVEARAVTKEIGYRLGGPVYGRQAVDETFQDAVLLKKMVPWKVLQGARTAGATVELVTPSRTFTKDSETITYYEMDVRAMLHKLLAAVTDRIRFGSRVDEVNRWFVRLGNGTFVIRYEHLVSTLPAPLFAKLWSKELVWKPVFRFAPVTFVISSSGPRWWDDRFAMVYDADPDSPVSRVGRFGDQWRYEVTGLVDQEDVVGLSPNEPVAENVFVHPFGRIYQDFELESPSPSVTFLGRYAEWDYRGLIDRTLERVHGLR